MDFEDFQRMFGSLEKAQGDDKSFASPGDAEKALEGFLSAKPDFVVGDNIERNAWGKHRYAFPKKNQVMKVLSIHEHCEELGLDDKLMGNDMITAVALDKENIRIFACDSRFFKKAKSTTNVSFFKKL